MLQKIMARCDNDDDTESVNSDITNDITEKLKQNDLALLIKKILMKLKEMWKQFMTTKWNKLKSLVT